MPSVEIVAEPLTEVTIPGPDAGAGASSAVPGVAKHIKLAAATMGRQRMTFTTAPALDASALFVGADSALVDAAVVCSG